MTQIIQRILKGIGYSLSEAVSKLAFTNLREDSAGNPVESEAAFIGRSWLAVGVATVVGLVFSVVVSLIPGPIGTLFSIIFGLATLVALLAFALVTMLVAVAVGVVLPGKFTAQVGRPMIAMIWWVVALLVLLLVVPNVGSFWILPTLLVSLIAYYVAPVAHPARSWIGITALVAVCAFLFSPDLIPSIIDRTLRETRSLGGELTQQLNCSDRPDHEDCEGWRNSQAARPLRSEREPQPNPATRPVRRAVPTDSFTVSVSGEFNSRFHRIGTNTDWIIVSMGLPEEDVEILDPHGNVRTLEDIVLTACRENLPLTRFKARSLSGRTGRLKIIKYPFREGPIALSC